MLGTGLIFWQRSETVSRSVLAGGRRLSAAVTRPLTVAGHCFGKAAEKVYLVYRRTRKEMPANEVEIVASEHEGIEFVFLAAPNKVIGDEDNHVAGLEYLKWKPWRTDASGRRRPVPVEGSWRSLDVDTIITAIGQVPAAVVPQR
ncbi:MAG: hypothetical protein R2861_16510 [Desulfobacterales bacterium]